MTTDQDKTQAQIAVKFVSDDISHKLAMTFLLGCLMTFIGTLALSNALFQVLFASGIFLMITACAANMVSKVQRAKVKAAQAASKAEFDGAVNDMVNDVAQAFHPIIALVIGVSAGLALAHYFGAFGVGP